MKATVSACPLESTVMLLNGRWRSLILYWLDQGPMRFNELRRANAGISPRMLSLDLHELEKGGVVSRTVVPAVPAHVEYALTDAGRALMPLLKALGDWWDDTRDTRTSGAAGATPHPGA